MKFNRNDEINLYYALLDIVGAENLIIECIPNKYLAFAVRIDDVWELHEIIGKGGEVIKRNSAYNGYIIKIGG